MIIYKPTNQRFENRLQAKKYFGAGLYKRLMKFERDSFILIDNSTLANDGNTICKNTAKVSDLR